MTRSTPAEVATLEASGDELIEALASALRVWVGRQTLAEERLTSFAARCFSGDSVWWSG